MKLLIVLFSVIYGASSQGVSMPTCTYWESSDRYLCLLSIQNPNGWLFGSISGTHLPGRSNNDVNEVRGASGSHTIIIPEIICQQFPNLQHLELVQMGITAITSARLRCNNLDTLNLSANIITRIAGFPFENLPLLKTINLGRNPIDSMDGGIFANLTNLENFHVENAGIFTINPSWFAPLRSLRIVDLNHNQISELPRNTFIQNSMLQHVTLFSNKITTISRDAFGYLGNFDSINLSVNGMNAVDPRIFEDGKNLNHLFFQNNLCADLVFSFIIDNRTQFNEDMRVCFANYR